MAMIRVVRQVSQLRMLVPTAEHPSWLGNKAAAKCPTQQAPWRPAFMVDASLAAGHFAGDGTVTVEMPCGTMDAEAAELRHAISIHIIRFHNSQVGREAYSIA